MSYVLKLTQEYPGNMHAIHGWVMFEERHETIEGCIKSLATSACHEQVISVPVESPSLVCSYNTIENGDIEIKANGWAVFEVECDDLINNPGLTA